MNVTLAVIPVAGHGTRLLPATKSQPKEMLPVGRKPVVQYVVEELAQAGIRQMVFVTGRGKDSIENHFDVDAELIAYLRETGREGQLGDLEFERLQVDYCYTRQRRQLGLGHAVLCARHVVGDKPFVVALGDSIIGLHAQSTIVRKMIAEFERTGADAVICLEEVAPAEVVRYGIARPKCPATAGVPPGEVFELASLVEKPAVGEAPSNLAVAARYVFSPAIFTHLAACKAGKGNEIQLTDAICSLLESGGRGLGVRLPATERRYDIGNFESYFRAFAEFALSDKEYGAALREHVAGLLRAAEQKL